MTQKKKHAQSHCERSVAIARLSNRTDDAITTQTSFARNDKCSAFTLAEGATHVDTCDNVRKNAFTLAEVLITLAIIGVVAAMTIPTLISSYKKKVVEVKLNKFNSMMQQVIQLSQVDNGSIDSWDTTDTEAFFSKYLKNYLKVLKTEKRSTNDLSIDLADGTNSKG